MQGRKAVTDSLSTFTPIAFVVDSGSDEFEFLAELGVAIYEASQAEMQKISTLENVPEIVGVFKIPEPATPAVKSDGDFYLALDRVQDPGNLGTIIRAAHWFGVRRIFCSKDTADIYNPKVVQSTMGSLGRVEVIYCDLEDLFKNNPKLPVYGLLLRGENIFNGKKREPGFILMGSEGSGISRELIPYITSPLTIPPANPEERPESLNVAVATAITLAELIKP